MKLEKEFDIKLIKMEDEKKIIAEKYGKIFTVKIVENLLKEKLNNDRSRKI